MNKKYKVTMYFSDQYSISIVRERTYEIEAGSRTEALDIAARCHETSEESRPTETQDINEIFNPKEGDTLHASAIYTGEEAPIDYEINEI